MNSKKLKRKIFKKVPEFKTDLEEAEFWDTHSLTDYYDFSKGKLGGFILDEDAKKDMSFTIRLLPDMGKRLKKVANDLGLSASSLARMWLIEKLAVASFK